MIGIIIVLVLIIIIFCIIGYALWSIKGALTPRDSYTISTSGGLRCPDGYDQPDGVGGLCYPRCKAGYKPFGCCLCTPVCPSGMGDTGTGCMKGNCNAGGCPGGFTDIGCFCQKGEAYGRGAGILPKVCPTGQTQSGALCYPACKAGYSNVAGVCWENP